MLQKRNEVDQLTSFLVFVFPLDGVSFYVFGPYVGYQFSFVSSLNKVRVQDPLRHHLSEIYARAHPGSPVMTLS